MWLNEIKSGELSRHTGCHRDVPSSTTHPAGDLTNNRGSYRKGERDIEKVMIRTINATTKGSSS